LHYRLCQKENPTQQKPLREVRLRVVQAA
jgi:hypothetical protein